MMKKKYNDKGELINQAAQFTRLYIYLASFVVISFQSLKINRLRILFGFFLKNRFCWVDTLLRANEGSGKASKGCFV